MDDQTLKGHLPVLVLGALRERPMHGFALAKEIKQRSRGVLKLGEGTLYPLLYRLERQKLLSSQWETAPSGKERKLYRVTRAGMRHITQAEREWRALSDVVGEFMGKEWLKA